MSDSPELRSPSCADMKVGPTQGVATICRPSLLLSRERNVLAKRSHLLATYPFRTGASHGETAHTKGEFCDLSGHLGGLPYRGTSERAQQGRNVARGQVDFDLGLDVLLG